MAAPFACLRANEVDADVESFLDMLGMADHLRGRDNDVGKLGEREVRLLRS